MSESDFYTVNNRYKAQGAAAEWPAWELQGYGSAAPAPEPAAPEEPAPGHGSGAAPPCLDPLGPWFSARLNFADGARIDVLVAVLDDRLTVEDMRADPPLTLDGLATLARWIEGPLDDACRLAAGRPRKPGPAPGAGEGPSSDPTDPAPLVPTGEGRDEGAGEDGSGGTDSGAGSGRDADFACGPVHEVPLVPGAATVHALGSAPAGNGAAETVSVSGRLAPPAPAPPSDPAAPEQPASSTPSTSGPRSPSPSALLARTRVSERRRLAAQVYREAQRAGQDPVLAVMNATGRNRRRSLRLIAGARDEGFLTPRHNKR